MTGKPLDRRCIQVRSVLDAYIDHELTEDAAREIGEHLEGCAACASVAASRRLLKSRVKIAGRRQVAGPELAVLVRQRIEQADTKRWWHPDRWAGWTQWAGAAAACAVIAVLWANQPEPAPIGASAVQRSYIQKISARIAGAFRPGIADHVHCAVFRRYPANPPSADQMLAELGPYRDLLPAVQSAVPASFRVVMAHQCTYQGRKYVHVVLRGKETVTSLVLTRKNAGESLAGTVPVTRVQGIPLFTARAGQYGVIAMESADHFAYVVSDSGQSEELNLATAVLPNLWKLMAQNL